MSIKIKPTSYTSAAPDQFVATTADTESPITRKGMPEGNGDGDGRWQELIDRLITWAENLDALADEGIESPSHKTIELAADLALKLKWGGAECPDSVIPDPNGGIVFKYCRPSEAMVFHVWDDGSIDRCIFNGPRLVERLRMA